MFCDSASEDFPYAGEKSGKGLSLRNRTLLETLIVPVPGNLPGMKIL